MLCLDMRIGFILLIFLSLALSNIAYSNVRLVNAAGLESLSATAYPVGYDLIPMNKIHTWELKLFQDDANIEGVKFNINGGMDAHGHALPTHPNVSEVGEGIYRINGLKFQMPGLWYFELKGSLGENPLYLRFEFEVMP